MISLSGGRLELLHVSLSYDVFHVCRSSMVTSMDCKYSRFREMQMNEFIVVTLRME